MTKPSALPTSVDGMLELLTSRGYLAERSLATVTYLALKMGRPLFLEGEAGVGKTEIAKVLSAALGRKLIRLQCYEGLDVSSAVYEWNSASQMIAIRAGGSRRRYRPRSAGQRHLRRALPDQASAAAGAGAGRQRRAGAADRRTRSRRRGVRSLSSRNPQRLPGDDPRARHGQGAGAADRHRHHRTAPARFTTR
jgi:hypothetical protein